MKNYWAIKRRIKVLQGLRKRSVSSAEYHEFQVGIYSLRQKLRMGAY